MRMTIEWLYIRILRRSGGVWNYLSSHVYLEYLLLLASSANLVPTWKMDVYIRSFFDSIEVYVWALQFGVFKTAGAKVLYKYFVNNNLAIVYTLALVRQRLNKQLFWKPTRVDWDSHIVCINIYRTSTFQYISHFGIPSAIKISVCIYNIIIQWPSNNSNLLGWFTFVSNTGTTRTSTVRVCTIYKSNIRTYYTCRTGWVACVHPIVLVYRLCTQYPGVTSEWLNNLSGLCLRLINNLN